MDSSPKPSKKSNTTDSPSSDPVEVQKSPIFTYISNLSPIKSVKAAPAPQGFPGLNSPPLVFTSPRINSRCDSAFLTRSQFARLSGGGLSGKDENFKVAVTVADESGISNAQLSRGLTACPQNGFVNNNSPPQKASSLSASADDFLTNVVNMDGSAFTCSDDIPQSVNSLVHSTESEVKIKGRDDNGKNVTETGASPLMSEQAEEVHQVKPSSDLKPAEADEKPGAGNVPSEPCPTVQPNLPIACPFNNNCGRYSKAENVGANKEAELGCTSQFESQWNVEEQRNCGEHTDAQCIEAGQNKMQHDRFPKVGLQQRGVRRRCLQFEDAQRKTTEKSICAHNLSGTAGFPSSPASPEVLEVLESSSLDKPAIPSTGLLANLNQPTFSTRHTGNYTMKVPKPSGIGLHLNSIVNAMQMGSGATVSLKSAERGSLSILGKKSSSTMSCHSSKNCSISLNRAEGVSVSSEDSRHDSVASIATSSANSLSPYSVEHLNDSLLFKPIELQSNPFEKRKSRSENADSADDFSPSSPKKKRKKTDTDDRNGCKRCNCKKTKCLKLYCDCFAAGIYCAEPCTCQECLNRPEYEDTVLETRQQIESRNPLAFAPKIVQHISEPPTSSCGDDGTRYTPASARHKRGCNCKKSKCLKKYCECYQSNVGCSDGCRCEGCENMYGRKGEYSMIKDLVSKHESDERLDGSFDKQLELVAPRDGLLHNELCNPHNLTPLTPPFQYSNHGKFASKSWFSSGRYLPSPESGLNFLAPYGMSPGPAMNPDNHGVIQGTNNEIMDLVSFDQELEYGSGDTMNQFSPGFDGHRDPGYLPAIPNPQNSANMLRTQMFPGNRHVSSTTSLRWRSSPISPMTDVGGTKQLEVSDFDGRLYSMLDDDTPEILKETPTPPNAVKVSSPNKKRVSPPHGRGAAIGSSSSAGLRSGRKFILQAVPSFPPLTPCIDSKVYAGQNMNDSQDCSRLCIDSKAYAGQNMNDSQDCSRPCIDSKVYAGQAMNDSQDYSRK